MRGQYGNVPNSHYQLGDNEREDTIGIDHRDEIDACRQRRVV